jgi:hypothetical protein
MFFMFRSCLVVIDVLCIFIFVCTSVGPLPPGESPVAVSNNNNIIFYVQFHHIELTKTERCNLYCRK